MGIKLSVIIPVFNQADLIRIGLHSIPASPKIETIVVDDGSSDGTLDSVQDYIQEHPDKNIRTFRFEDNRGTSCAVNQGLEMAQGEYVVLLGSDGDYFVKDFLTRAVNYWLDGKADLVYFDLIDNNKHIRRLSPRTKFKYVGAVKFMRRAFIGKIRCPEEMRRAEDVVFTQQLLAKNPKERYIGQVGKHYNYPREGSLTWKYLHEQTDYSGNTLK